MPEKYVIRPSARLVVLLLLSHVLAAAVVAATAMPWHAKPAILMLILLSLIYYLARDALMLLSRSWREISFDSIGASVVTRGGSAFSGDVASKTLVSPYFVVLRISSGEHRLPVSRAIFPDMLGSDEFRETCVRLKFSQKAS